ncbi:MAG: hypothetical protein LBG11_01105 [Bifidobacteriaceae bacterium]|nr:hypothetical protein [Bifidobacteriaceae bacterium]
MRKSMHRIGVAVATLGLAVTAFVAGPASAAPDDESVVSRAASCLIGDKKTSTKAADSTVFTTSGSSACKDLNAAFAFSKADKVKGQYKTSSGWKDGSRGFQPVDVVDPGWGKWRVLISDLTRGTTVRGVAEKHTQTVRYVW